MSVSPEQFETDRRLGRVSAVHGSVVDIAFASGVLPAINDAVAIEWDLGPPLVAEVQQHLGPTLVRVVALGNTAGGAARPYAPLVRRSVRRLAIPCSAGC